ncbi:MAG: hypothetical protein ACPGID_02235, partial [Rubricella sp.]
MDGLSTFLGGDAARGILVALACLLALVALLALPRSGRAGVAAGRDDTGSLLDGAEAVFSFDEDGFRPLNRLARAQIGVGGDGRASLAAIALDTDTRARLIGPLDDLLMKGQRFTLHGQLADDRAIELRGWTVRGQALVGFRDVSRWAGEAHAALARAERAEAENAALRALVERLPVRLWDGESGLGGLGDSIDAALETAVSD